MQVSWPMSNNDPVLNNNLISRLQGALGMSGVRPKRFVSTFLTIHSIFGF